MLKLPAQPVVPTAKEYRSAAETADRYLYIIEASRNIFFSVYRRKR
jgi:hypothetical protein